MNLKRILIRSLVLVFAFMAVLYSGVVGFFMYNEPKLIYAPVRHLNLPADGVPFERVSFTASDGVRLSGWAVTPDQHTDANGYWILFLHGNQGNVATAEDLLRMARKLGFQTLALDYRGYGDSLGTPSETGLYLDARAAFDYLVRTRSVPPARIIAYGHSLGAAVAAELAEERHGGGLVIQAGFTSLPAIGQEMFPFLPVELIARQRFDTVHRIGKIGCPKLFLYGREDHLVPPKEGRILFELANPPKTWVLVNGDHDPVRTDEGACARALQSFLQQLRQYALASAEARS